ncbi:MAG: segregation/condensation protein A [Archaeoglobaceae archaeon]
MLVELARRGDVDPWNVDVIDVADKFLSELERAKKLDLRISGRVLLFTAILVRMKAEILTNEAIVHEEQQEEEEQIETEMEAEIVPDEIDFDAFNEPEPEPDDFDEELMSLEQEVQKDEVLDTLLKPRKKAKRFTTLKDLIHELQMAEDVEKKRKKRKRQKKGEEPEATRQTLGTPHEENLEETIAKVEEELKYLFNRKTMLYFSEVVRGMGTEEKISYYLSILHLAYRKKVEVYQKELYEEDIELKHYS